MKETETDNGRLVIKRVWAGVDSDTESHQMKRHQQQTLEKPTLQTDRQNRALCVKWAVESRRFQHNQMDYYSSD